MLDTILTGVDAIFASFGKMLMALPFTGPTWFILALAVFFVWLFMKASKDPNSRVNWEDLVLDTVTKTASPYKIGYLIGVVLVSFIMLVSLDRDKLTMDILGICLAYLLGGAGWTNFLQNKTTTTEIRTRGGMLPPSKDEEPK